MHLPFLYIDLLQPNAPSHTPFVVDGIMSPDPSTLPSTTKDAHSLIPGNYEYVRLYGKGESGY